MTVESNDNDGRQRDIKKSRFVSSTTAEDSATFDFVYNGQNIKITKADLVALFGTTGSLEQLGEVLGTPVLSKSGTINRIRNIIGGSGVVSSVSPENGVQLDHNFTQDSTGVPVLASPTATSPIIRSLSAGLGINIAAQNGNIQISLSATPATTKTIIVSTMSDFPTAVAGVRTLEDDTQYFVVADLTTSDRFVLGDDTVFSGSDGTLISMTYTGTGDMFTSANSSNKVKDIILSSPNGRVFNMSCSMCTNLFQTVGIRILECDKIGVFDNLFGVNFENFLFFDVKTDGMEFLNDAAIINMSSGIVTQNAGKFLNLGSSTFTALSVDTLFVTLASGTYFLSGVSNSANVNTGGLGTIVNTRTFGAGSDLENITVDDNLWQFDLNNRIADTREDGLLSLRSNATETAIAVIATPVLVGGTWVVEETSKFTGTTAGRLTYTGPKDIKLPVTVTLTGSPVTGTSIQITFHLYKNGVKITNAEQPNVVSATSPKNTTLIWQVELETDDYLEVFVSNDSTTANVLITDATFRIN